MAALGLGELGPGWWLSKRRVGKPAFSQTAPSEKKPAQLLKSGGNDTQVFHGRQQEACEMSSPTQPRARLGKMGLGLNGPPPGTPDSLGMLDGPVQGAEKCAALLHHAVEVGLVKEVTLGIAEVLGTKPGQRSQRVRGDPGAVEARMCGRAGCWPPGPMGTAPPSPLLSR